MPNALDLLTADHRKVDELFSEFESSGDETVAAQICDELTIHTRVEEQIVYPELRTLDAELEQEAEREHADAKQLIEQIRAARGDEIVGLVDRLKQAIEHHVAEEEGKAFPELEALGDARLNEMGQQIADAKSQAAA
jgi:hemerythrin superfamily protein